jgi:hypothetical protein
VFDAKLFGEDRGACLICSALLYRLTVFDRVKQKTENCSGYLLKQRRFTCKEKCFSVAVATSTCLRHEERDVLDLVYRTVFKRDVINLNVDHVTVLILLWQHLVEVCQLVLVWLCMFLARPSARVHCTPHLVSLNHTDSRLSVGPRCSPIRCHNGNFHSVFFLQNVSDVIKLTYVTLVYEGKNTSRG